MRASASVGVINILMKSAVMLIRMKFRAKETISNPRFLHRKAQGGQPVTLAITKQNSSKSSRAVIRKSQRSFFQDKPLYLRRKSDVKLSLPVNPQITSI